MCKEKELREKDEILQKCTSRKCKLILNLFHWSTSDGSNKADGMEHQGKVEKSILMWSIKAVDAVVEDEEVDRTWMCTGF